MRRIGIAVLVAGLLAAGGLSGSAVAEPQVRGSAARSAGDGVIGDITAQVRAAQVTRARGVAASRAKRALFAGPLVGGKHPNRPQPNEPYLPQVSCYAGELPGVAAFRQMLLSTYPRSSQSLGTYNISRGCNVPGISEHEEGRALDWEARVADPRQDAQARRLLRWLTKRGGYHAKRFGILYLIYDRHVWGQYNQRWRAMGNRGSVTDNHQDHVHFTFTWNGALARTPWWTGKVRAVNRGPCPVYRGSFAPIDPLRLTRQPRTGGCPRLRSIPSGWRFGPAVMYWQSDEAATWLNEFLTEAGLFVGDVKGGFGRTTYQAVQAYQRRNGLPLTGVWDAATQHASGRTVEQRDPTTVTWDAAELSVLPGAVVSVPVTVDGPGSVRKVRVDRMLGRKEYVEVARSELTVPGQWTAAFQPEPGTARYRITVERTSFAKVGRSDLKSITVTQPVPSSPTALPDPPSPSASPSPSLPPEGTPSPSSSPTTSESLLPCLAGTSAASTVSPLAC